MKGLLTAVALWIEPLFELLFVLSVIAMVAWIIYRFWTAIA